MSKVASWIIFHKGIPAVVFWAFLIVKGCKGDVKVGEIVTVSGWTTAVFVEWYRCNHNQSGE